MPSTLIPVTNNLDSGVVKDIPSIKLLPASWTDSRNMAFDNGSSRKSKGHDSILTPSVAPYFMMPSPSLDQEFWLYAGLAKVFGFIGMTQGDITRISGDYTGASFDRWNGGVFNGIPFLNNGIDLPQTWNTIALGTPLVDMPAWPGTQRAKVVRAFKSYIVALDVTKAGTRDGRMVKWSSSAPPGALPGTWDETDSTNDAGETTLPEGSDGIIDGVELGNSFIIYTKRSTWSMDFIGGNFIFHFRKRFAEIGLIAQQCAVQFENKHFVVTQSDVIVHDATAVQSIADAKVRRWLYDNLNDDSADLTTVIPNPIDNEIWTCFPFGSTGVLNRALVWNWKFNSWAIRDLPDIRAIGMSVRNPFVSPNIWDAQTDAWSAGTDPWTQEGISTASLENVVVMSPPDLTGIVQVGNSFQFSGKNYTSFVERRGITTISTGGGEFIPVDNPTIGRIIQDPDRFRMGLSVKPIVEARDGTRLSILFGSHDSLEGPIRWKGPRPFIVGKDRKIDLYPSGKFLSLRIEDTGSTEWKMSGYVIELASMGRF